MESGVSEAKCVYSGVREVDCVWRVGLVKQSVYIVG